MKNYDTIEAICKQHRTHTYFDGGGLIGVYNHANKVAWYRLTEGGYSLVGTTNTPLRSQERKIDK